MEKYSSFNSSSYKSTFVTSELLLWGRICCITRGFTLSAVLCKLCRSYISWEVDPLGFVYTIQSVVLFFFREVSCYFHVDIFLGFLTVFGQGPTIFAFTQLEVSPYPLLLSHSYALNSKPSLQAYFIALRPKTQPLLPKSYCPYPSLKGQIQPCGSIISP